MELFEIVYHEWKPGEQKLREALCTLGNGYFATRGAAEESGNDEFNYPGTYIAGGYNRARTEISGRIIENEDFVNFPNWLYLSFRPEGGDWLNLNQVTIHSYRQTLDMKQGMLIREFPCGGQKWKDNVNQKPETCQHEGYAYCSHGMGIHS
jgi:trehalose/maltose hydrolase-like predicted phosphorylase